MTQPRHPTSAEPARMGDILADLPQRSREMAERVLSPPEKDERLQERRRQLEETARLERGNQYLADIEKRRMGATDAFFKIRGERYENCTLANFEVGNDPATRESKEHVLSRCRWFCEGEDRRVMCHHINYGGNVILTGAPGTGKDHLLSAMLREVLQNTGFKVAWTNGPALCQSFRDAIDSKTSESKQLERWCTPHILAISDLIIEGVPLSDYAQSQLYQILDYRASHLRGVWVTLNVEKESTIIDAIGRTLYDRLFDCSFRLFFNWPSYRRHREAKWLDPKWHDQQRREIAAFVDALSDEPSDVSDTNTTDGEKS